MLAVTMPMMMMALVNDSHILLQEVLGDELIANSEYYNVMILSTDTQAVGR